MSTYRARRKPVYVPPPARGDCPTGKVRESHRIAAVGDCGGRMDPSYTDVIPGRNGTIQWGHDA